MRRRVFGRAVIAIIALGLGSGVVATDAFAANVTIGAVLPLTGTSATAGQASANGAQLAIEQANSAHLVAGVTFSFVARNDVGTAGAPDGTAGASQIRSLSADGRVAGLLAPFDTTTAMGELPVINRVPIATVSPSATDTCLTITAALGCTGDAAELANVQPTGRTTFFRVAPADFLGQQALADYLQAPRGLHTVYIVDDQTPRGIGQADVFISRWQLDGGAVVGHVSANLSAPSFINLLTQIAAVRPDVLLYAGNNVATGIALRRQMLMVPGLAQTAFAVSSALDTAAFAQAVGVLGGPVWAPATEPALAQLPSTATFAAQYQARFGAPSEDAARGYDAAEALLRAIKAAIAGGARVPAGATASATAFRAAVLSKLPQVTFTGADGPIAFLPNGDLTQGPIGIVTLSLTNGTPNWVPAALIHVTSPVPASSLSPPALDFGSVPIHGGRAQLSVRLTNTGVIPFPVGSVTLGNAAYKLVSTTCTQTNVVPAAQCVVTIRFAPTTTGPFKTLLTLSDPAGAPLQTATLLGVGIPPAQLTLSNTVLPEGAVGVAYTSTLTAHGGIPPYHWSLVQGALPAGLSLNAATGALTGTPTTPGRFQATVKVTDSATTAPQTTTGLIALRIAPPVPAAFYVVNGANSSVRDFALTATGNAAPLTTLAGADTQLDGTSAVAISSIGGLYVANADADSVTEYEPGASGDAHPIAILAGPDTGLAFPAAVALGPQGDLYVVNGPAGTVTVYPPGATGDTAPIRTITGLLGPTALTFDHAGNLWVDSSQTNAITRYNPTANGAATPLAKISGASTGLNGPHGLTVNSAGEILVADEFSHMITAYDPAATGDVAPVFAIAGADTGLSFPVGIDLDNQGNLYVSNTFDNKITVYRPGARGDTPPIRTISGAATGLAAPGLLAVTPPLTILTRALPAARVGRHYRTRLWAALGIAPYRWKTVRGRLPRGLALNTRTGVLSGTPRRRMTAHFRITVRDDAHPADAAARSLVLTVKPRKPAPRPRARR